MPDSESWSAPDETTPLLGALLRRPYQAMMLDAVEPSLAAAGFGDLRSAHLPVIQSLTQSPAGLRATDLAGQARITKQSMGYLVDALQASGYIERVPDPTDGRAKVVRLTARGWDAVQVTRAAVRRVEAEWAARIGSRRVETLRRILHDLASGLPAADLPPDGR